MTNPQTVLSRERQPNDSAARVIPKAIERALKGINTAMPGEVISYDADTRRANVRGSIQLLMVDGTTVDRPVIANAPVVFPMSGTFAMTWPLHAGDPVLLVFSQRGIGNWKREHAQSPPAVDSLLSERDAMVIPGFGPSGMHEPDIRIVATDDSLTVQRADAERIRFASDGITIESAGTVSVTGGNVSIAGTATVNSVSVADANAGTGSVAVGNHGSHTHTLTAA